MSHSPYDASIIRLVTAVSTAKNNTVLGESYWKKRCEQCEEDNNLLIERLNQVLEYAHRWRVALNAANKGAQRATRRYKRLKDKLRHMGR